MINVRIFKHKLYDFSGNQTSDTRQEYHKDEPFYCMFWLKMVFMAGFALSQFIINLFYDNFKILKYCVRTLIISGIIASGAGNVYIFAIAWFVGKKF